jgi:hypothetical protein
MNRPAVSGFENDIGQPDGALVARLFQHRSQAGRIPRGLDLHQFPPNQFPLA